MKRIELRMNERYKYEMIKKLVESNGNKNRAALKLNCTTRTINRLILKYKQYGKAAFIHGNTGRPPACTFDSAVKEKVCNIYTTLFGDTNLSHFIEILKKDYQITISSTTLNRWLKEKCILSPKAHRKTKRLVKKVLRDHLKQTSSIKSQDQMKEAIQTIDESFVHPTRPRCKYAGEMIQMDASSFQWVHGKIWHLHLAVDDATGTVVGAYFDRQETLNGYYHVFEQILKNYGIPALFYTDKRTVFEYTKRERAFDDEDTFTQFSYACHQLGVQIKTTSVAQAKGRIERLNQSFQSRLPVELRRNHIVDMNAANVFLKSYLKEYNAQFALHLNSKQSVYEKQPSTQLINRTLSIISKRKINAGHHIQFKNKKYRFITSCGEPCYFTIGTTALVIESYDGKLYANVLDQLFILQEIPTHELYSKNFDIEPKIEKKKSYIPPLSHPWKQASFNNYLIKMKHRVSRC